MLQYEAISHLDVIARKNLNESRGRVSMEMPIDQQSELETNYLSKTQLSGVNIILTSFLGNTKFGSDSPAVRIFNRFQWVCKCKKEKDRNDSLAFPIPISPA